jgi:hypothetical protein
MEGRKVSETLNIHTELIMPGHTNPIGNLMGGHLLSMDGRLCRNFCYQTYWWYFRNGKFG